jgi:YVTN family beta-propeller protein
MWRCSWLLIAGLAASLPAYADTACVSNEKSDTVSLIEPCKLPVVKTIGTGQRPRGLQVTQARKHVRVCIGGDDAVRTIDNDTDNIVATLPSGAGPEQLVDHPYGRRLPVAPEDRNMVAAIDIGKCTGFGQVPVGERPGDVFIAAP